MGRWNGCGAPSLSHGGSRGGSRNRQSEPAPLDYLAVQSRILGAVILPLAGFTLLRYVPLGRALAETIVATALGGAIGVQFLGGWWLAGPLAGFGVAATRLWALARRGQSLVGGGCAAGLAKTR